MMPIYSVREPGINHFDALVLHDQLIVELERLLPVRAAVEFWLHDFYPRVDEFNSRQQKILRAERKGTSPFVQGGMLVVPLSVESADRQVDVDVVVYDVDPALLKKMASQWLSELQEKIQDRLLQIKRIYTDPGTGLYNQRALAPLLAGNTCWKSLFLIATVSRKRTIAGGCRKVNQLASLLDAVIHEPLFYFGQGVFGCVSQQCDRRTALDFSHRLVSRLKREEVHRVHVGFSCLTGEQSSENTFHDCWSALIEAERRGPYSLCDADFLKRRDRHPLALPPPSILRKLQRRWSGLNRFGMVLISFDIVDDEKPLQYASLLSDESYGVELSAGQLLLLLPDYTAARTAEEVKRLAEQIKIRTDLCAAIGYSHWPSDGTSRIDSVRNCRKAILHGSFYGAGAQVAFDFLSLNVSGDLYFDEGDYKQAIREYRAGLRMQPGDINLLNSLGVALAEVNRHREAIDCFSLVLESDRANHMALVNKGMSCRLLGWNTQAMDCFEQALLCPDHVKEATLELYLQLGRLYCLTEQYDHAVQLLQKWRKIKGLPEEFMFFRIMGEACMGLGQNRDAIESLQHSLQLHPGNADSQSMLGLLYVLEGEGAEVGLSLCNRAVSQEEDNAEYFFRLASALSHLGKNSEALAAVRIALQIKRNYDQAILLRGRIYEKIGRVSRAVQSYQRIDTLKTAADSCKKEARARLKKMNY